MQQSQQFIIVPPFEKIVALFTALTGQPFVAACHWNTWNRDDAQIESFRSYIRPCHQKLLDNALKTGKVLPFLRQLLRPYEYHIEANIYKKYWKLCSDSAACVHTEPVVVEWSS